MSTQSASVETETVVAVVAPVVTESIKTSSGLEVSARTAISYIMKYIKEKY